MNNINPLYYLEEKSKYLKDIIKGTQKTSSAFLKGKAQAHKYGKEAAKDFSKGNLIDSIKNRNRGETEKKIVNNLFTRKSPKPSKIDNVVNKNAIMKKHGGKDLETSKWNMHLFKQLKKSI